MNVGVLSETFWLPEFPKVGFWTIRVHAQGQREEKKVKVEKPRFCCFSGIKSGTFGLNAQIEVPRPALYNIYATPFKRLIYFP